MSSIAVAATHAESMPVNGSVLGGVDVSSSGNGNVPPDVAPCCTTMEITDVLQAPKVSQTSTTKVYEPTRLGVPEKVPSGLSVTPGGKVPPANTTT